jgi:TetR/AcrR family transcriptional regulator of autoinduction and epiphytic fitness
MSVEAYRDRIKHEKRAAALGAAVDAFLTHGYDRTTLLQVAKAAGISTGTLFKHFPTKAALFGGIMEQLWAAEPGLDQRLPAPGDPRAGLTVLGYEYARVLRQPYTEPLFRVMIAEAPRFPELGQALFERGKAPFLARLTDYLTTEMAKGTLTITNMPIATRQFFGMINDVFFWPRLLVTDLPVTDAIVDEAVTEAVTTFVARYGAKGA